MTTSKGGEGNTSHQGRTTGDGKVPRFERISSKLTSDEIGEVEDEDDRDRHRSLEISPEDQIHIIRQTGILDGLARISPLEQTSHRSDHLDPTNSKPKKPLIEFSTHELDSFPKFQELGDGRSQSKPSSSPDHPNESPDLLPLWVDHAFDTFLWSIPFNTVFICLDVAIHAQYGQPVTIGSELNRLKSVFPSSIFILHYTLHHHEKILSKLLLFSLSTIGGSYMIYILNKLSYLLVMRRVPPLGALWLYSVIRMDLYHALLSLGLVGLWCWIMDLSLYV